MKILWITNSLFEEYYASKGKHASVTGGWMRALSIKLLDTYPDLEIAVAARIKDVKQLEEFQSEKFTFYALPGSPYQNKYDNSIEKDWINVKARFNPDLVHIHGSEFPHGLAYIRANGSKGVMLSLQGIISRIARYNQAGIKSSSLIKSLTFYDLFISSTPFKDTKRQRQLGKIEETLIKSVDNIIGRTTWDKVHTWAINPNVEYYFCNETLRPAFYSPDKWNKNTCKRHRIFLSQASKPLKGIHKVVEALPFILRRFPDTEVYIAGYDFTRKDSLRSRLRYMTYANYIYKLMKKLNVAEHFNFLGFLNSEQMAEQLRLANVFICPSSIENSPNSLGESQLIGCPVVASYVGGTPDMVENEKTGLLYRFEEHEMMAYNVCRIFDDNELATRLSQNGIIAALKRHDGDTNAKRMMEIYQSVLKKTDHVYK